MDSLFVYCSDNHDKKKKTAQSLISENKTLLSND